MKGILNRFAQHRAFYPACIVVGVIFSALVVSQIVIGSGDDDLADVPSTEKGGWVYGKIKYLHDIRRPNEYYMTLQAHPGQPVPEITGGFATTDTEAIVRLRGVSVPRELQHSDDRSRPHDWLDNEREKWDASMRYVWNLTQPNKTFKVYDLKVVDDRGDKVLEGSMEVFLGGQWFDLAIMMMQDGRARPEQADGSDWDWGMETVPLLNPNVPK